MPIEVRREQLLDAAIRVIVRDGYGGVSVDAIAREAGVTRPVVYGAFDGLGPLLGALLDRQQVRALEQLARRSRAERVRPGRGDARRGADDGRAGAAPTRSPGGRSCAAPQAIPDVVRERIEADRERVRSHVRRPARGRGRRTVVDVDLASHALVAILEHFGRILVEDPDRFDATGWSSFAADVLRIGRHATA